ncbi:Potassium voltage-gated channel sub H member 8 [Phytophthora boehmeriae]|uniref:Potassium voltage-gated channel sub H member 8 n=1 Tax=Phytophthora boehmeriae TaxID=109152 RepID=A0A8T1VQX0_9STRA|nr:Potassium voltage-gated channel sub H member 8 [Phytophthora boehmeriae]
MEQNNGETLPRIAEQRFDSSSTLEQPERSDSDRLRGLEDRLTGVEADMKTTHKMLRDLSVLVHRQLQVTVARNKNRSLSENIAPSSFQVLTNNSPLRNFGGLDPTRLIPTESPMDSPKEVDIGIDTNTDSTPVGGTPIDPAEMSKRPHTPHIHLDTEALSGIHESQEDDTSEDQHKPSAKLTPMPDMKFLKGRKHNPHEPRDDRELTWRFSVSSMNITQPPRTIIRMRTKIIPTEKPGRTGSVSTEEIIRARKIDGEVGPYTLRHDTSYRTAWDVFVMVLILLDVVFTPISMGFNYDSRFLTVYNVVEPVAFAFDFVIRMFSSYSDEHGNLISGPKRTVAHYLTSGWVIPDFLSWFPFEVFVHSGHSGVLGFVKIFRLAKVSHLARKLNSAKKAGIVRFILLLGVVLGISHFLACYWSWVAVVWREHLSENPFVPRSLFEEYSLCWSLVIGCINASPPIMYTAIEQISVACFMLVGNILQASVFGAVAALISSFDENEAAYSKKIITTMERCRFLGIPEQLTKRIQGYYENLWRETKSISGDADAFINELSPALICEVKFELYRDMMKRIPFLSSKTLSPAVIEMLILHLRTVIYMQDDVLIRKGEFGDWMGFIGSKGSVGILDPNSDEVQILCILRRGDFFGEMALLQHTRRSATTVALTWVQIHVLCRQDLDYVKELYPTQAELLEREITKYKKMQSEVNNSM